MGRNTIPLGNYCNIYFIILLESFVEDFVLCLVQSITKALKKVYKMLDLFLLFSPKQYNVRIGYKKM